MIKITSLFSGIGGFEKGIQQAGEKLNIETKFVFASEIDKYARTIYKKNYGVEPYGDITKIKASNIPNHDILCGGFPCQAFSIAGKRRGFEDTRGTLFFEIMRIAKTKRPKLLFLENVRGLLSHDSGETFQTILRSMDDMGYDAEWQVFNSKNHGVPQNRGRVFIIGHLRGAGTRPIFPITNNDGQVNEIQKQHTNCLTARYEGAQATGSYIIEDQLDAQINQLNNPTHSNNRVYDNNGLSPSLNCMEGGNRQPFIRCHSTLPRSSKTGKGGTGHLSKQDGSTYCIDAANNVAVEFVDTKQRGPPRYSKECPTLQASCYKEPIKISRNQNIRRLTPIECERLQGFPDNYTEGISDSQRYKCIGNAVTVNVIEFIAERLLKL